MTLMNIIYLDWNIGAHVNLDMTSLKYKEIEILKYDSPEILRNFRYQSCQHITKDVVKVFS